MKKLLMETKRYYAETEMEADQIIEDAKQENGSQVKKVTKEKKVRKGIEFFMVHVELNLGCVKDIIDEIVDLYGAGE